MGITNKLSELIKLFAIQSPFIIPLTIIGGSFASNEFFKPLFYVLGISFLVISWFFVANIIGHKRNNFLTKSSVCKMYSFFTESSFTAPAWNTSLLSYTFFYLLIPMVQNGVYRTFLMVLFAILILVDALVRWITLDCYGEGLSGFFDVLVGLGFGGLIAVIWYWIVYSINKKFVFFSESDSNRLTCGKSGKKQMKCTVYKNGVKSGSFFK
ncbi:hypothetical protein OAI84_00060 [bacterium]|nr:hypothetical protein [bacterium]